jgi:hypothetical protein
MRVFAGTSTQPIVDAPALDIVSPDAPYAPFALAGQRWLLPCLDDLGSYNCHVPPPQIQMVTLAGAASQHFMVTARIRGAMEEITYTGGGGSAGWYVGGGTNDGADNKYEMDVSAPAQHYYLNNGAPGCNCSRAFDYTLQFPIDGNATVVFTATGQDTLQWANYDASRVPITFAGVTTTPDPTASSRNSTCSTFTKARCRRA